MWRRRADVPSLLAHKRSVLEAVQMTPIYHFPTADLLFTVNRNRELRTMTWVAFQNDLFNFVEIMERPDGAAMFGVFVTLVLIASRSKQRWHLVDGLGRPYTAAGLARLSRLPVKAVEEGIRLLLEIGMLAAITSQEGATAPHQGATAPHDTAAETQAAATAPHLQTVQTDERDVTDERNAQTSRAPADDDQSLENPFSKFFEELYRRHPKRVNRVVSQEEAFRLYQSWNGNAEQMMAEVTRVHEAWCVSEAWKRQGGRFVPSLDRWLQDRAFEREPEGADEW
jgi:hypothetical protein